MTFGDTTPKFFPSMADGTGCDPDELLQLLPSSTNVCMDDVSCEDTSGAVPETSTSVLWGADRDASPVEMAESIIRYNSVV